MQFLTRLAKIGRRFVIPLIVIAPFALCIGAMLAYGGISFVEQYRSVNLPTKALGLVFGALTFIYVAQSPWSNENRSTIDYIKRIAWVIGVIDVGMIIGQTIGAIIAAGVLATIYQPHSWIICWMDIGRSHGWIIGWTDVGAIGWAAGGAIMWAIAGILARERPHGVIRLAVIGAVVGAIIGTIASRVDLVELESKLGLLPEAGTVIWMIAGVLANKSNTFGKWVLSTIGWTIGGAVGGVFLLYMIVLAFI